MSKSVTVIALRLTVWRVGEKRSGCLTLLWDRRIGNDRGNHVREPFDQRHLQERFRKCELDAEL